MKRVLVIGDGQLGLMLAQEAAGIGIELDRLCPERGLRYRGTGRRPEAVPQGWCADEYDVLTAEREHLPQNALLERLRGHPGFHAIHAIDLIADRRTQKALLDQLGIATAEWCVPQSREDVERFRANAGPRVVAKAARGGYDGRGQWRIGRAADAPDPREVGVGLIVERAVCFERELSLVGARFADGRMVFYPLVQNSHARGMLRFTLAPACVEAAMQQQAESMLGKVMDALDYVGVMAMELFEEAGELLVNELAPRVHNSGHWTQAGAAISQFGLHLRAICELPCTDVRASGSTLMLNLVGADFDPRWLDIAGASLHWYGKEPAPGRKLGHINLHAASRNDLPWSLCALLPALDDAHASSAGDALTLLVGAGAPAPLAQFMAGISNFNVKTGFNLRRRGASMATARSSTRETFQAIATALGGSSTAN